MKKLLIATAVTTAVAVTAPAFASIQAKTLGDMRLSVRVLNSVLNTIASNQVVLNAATLGNQASANFSTDAVDVAARKAGHGYISTITAPNQSTGVFGVELDGDNVPANLTGTDISCQPFGHDNTAFTGTAPYDNASMEIKGYGCWISSQPDNAGTTGNFTAVKLYSGDSITYDMVSGWNVQGQLPAGTVDMIGLAAST